jgi:hypothetical protein
VERPYERIKRAFNLLQTLRLVQVLAKPVKILPLSNGLKSISIEYFLLIGFHGLLKNLETISTKLQFSPEKSNFTL